MSYILMLIFALTATLSAQSEVERPNVIVIISDDQGYADLGCFGGDHVKTPNIDQMAAEGMKLTRFYAAPSCTPSRASLMTGSYPVRVGLPSVLKTGAKIGLNPQETTLAEVMKNAGYSTACIGKWHLGHYPKFMPNNHGFDYFFGLPYSNDMYPENAGRNFPPLPVMRNEKVIETQPDQRYLTKRFTEESIKFIKENKQKPFFIYLAHVMPHRPLYASEEFTKDIPKKKLDNAYPPNTKVRDFLYPNVISELDWSVGQLMKALKEQGVDKNTLVIFTADNGPSQGGLGKTTPFKGRKGATTEGGIRMPCVVRWPAGISAGTSFNGITSTMDLLPTFAALAGGKLPENKIDGVDISGVLKGKETVSPQKYFFYYKKNVLTAVSGARYKYFPEDFNGALFDLQNDLGEEKNLIMEKPEKVKEFKAVLEEMTKRLGNGKKRGSEHRPVGTLK